MFRKYHTGCIFNKEALVPMPPKSVNESSYFLSPK
jgi:hypothetical protein